MTSSPTVVPSMLGLLSAAFLRVSLVSTSAAALQNVSSSWPVWHRWRPDELPDESVVRLRFWSEERSGSDASPILGLSADHAFIGATGRFW